MLQISDIELFNEPLVSNDEIDAEIVKGLIEASDKGRSGSRRFGITFERVISGNVIYYKPGHKTIISVRCDVISHLKMVNKEREKYC